MLLVCAVKLNAQSWLNNDSIIGYKTSIKNYSDAVQNVSSLAIDNNDSTFIQFNSFSSKGACQEASYYYDLKHNLTINAFKIYCPSNGKQSTMRYFELYCSDNSDGNWKFVLKYDFDILNYNDNSKDYPSWYISKFQPQKARYWKLVALCHNSQVGTIGINSTDGGGFKIYEIGFGLEINKPIVYYPFNGNANDESGFNNNGRINGVTLTTDRFNKENSAYKFDGIDDYIRIPNANNISFGKNNWSISLWFNSAKLNQTSSLISKNSSNCWSTGGKQVMWNDSTFISLDCYGATGSPINMKLDTNTWYHYVVTYDHSLNLWKAYINGLIVSYVNFDMTNDTQDAIIKIGSGYKDCEYTYFNGKIDDIYIYNRTLSDEDIDTLYYSQIVEPIDTTTYVKNVVKPEIKIYPNPTSDIINIVGINVKQIEIFNISGIKVLISNNNQIDVSGLKCGTYISRIIGKNNEISTNKFIKN